MNNQPNDTRKLDIAESPLMGEGRLLATVAQQAVLPRKLEEGIYAILDGGAVRIVETEGYGSEREWEWEQAHAEEPLFIDRTVSVSDTASFLDYLDRNTNGEGVTGVYAHSAGSLELWADIDNRKITAILDGITGRRKHTATFVLKTSRGWDEWSAIDGKLYGQVEFAQFIEDHLSTIYEPDGARLIDICQTLEAKTSVVFKQQQLIASGQRQFRYEETIETKAGQKGDLTIPSELTLAISPFYGSEPKSITARFRYRISEGQLRLGVKLAEPETVLENAFNAVIAEVLEGVPVHINHGRP